MAQVIKATEIDEDDVVRIERLLRRGDDGLPLVAQQLLRELVRGVRAGRSTVIAQTDDLLTTTQAAKLLGVSRPRVAQLIDQGLLGSTRVGRHHRLRLGDVLERRRRRDGLDELRREMYEGGHPEAWDEGAGV